MPVGKGGAAALFLAIAGTTHWLAFRVCPLRPAGVLTISTAA